MNRVRLVLLMLLVMAFAVSAGPAFAAADLSQAVGEPFMLRVDQVFISSCEEADDTFHYKFRPLETGGGSGAPMPHGSADDGYIFSIRGSRSGHIGPFIWERQGIYHYEIFQVSDMGRHGYKHDKSLYRVEAYVCGELKADFILKNDRGDKVEAIAFENEYYLNEDNEEPEAEEPEREAPFTPAPRQSEGKGFRTGDETDIFSLILIMVLSGILIAGLVFLAIRKYPGR